MNTEAVWPEFAAEDLACLGPGGLKIPHERVKRASQIVSLSNCDRDVARWRAEDRAGRGPGGRPSLVSDHAALTVLLLLALEHSSIDYKRMAKLVATRLAPESRDLLGLPPVGASFDQWYHRLSRSTKKFLRVLDGFEGPRWERPTERQLAEILATRDPAESAKKNVRLDAVANGLIHASYLMIPKDQRKNWDGASCVDGTFISVMGRGSSRELDFIGFEYDAGRYYREGDHGPASSGIWKNSKWGYEATFVTMANVDLKGLAKFPLLITAMSFDRPASRPAENALVAYTSMFENNLPTGLVVGDAAYGAGTTDTKYQLPLRAMGYQLVMTYKKGQHGIQEGFEGAIQVDGWWYCPTMPQILIEASDDFNKQRIDLDTYYKRIEARRRYAATRKALPGRNGQTRYSHPVDADGKHLCDKGRTDAGKFCQQRTLVFPVEAGAKFAQELQYMSPEWRKAFTDPRTTIEGQNGYLKNHSTFQLDQAGRRRLRGRAANHLMTALIVVAANVAKILTFLDDLKDDSKGLKERAAKRDRRRRRPYNWDGYTGRERPDEPDPLE